MDVEYFATKLLELLYRLQRGGKLSKDDVRWLNFFYDACIRHVDRHVGLLLEGMEELGLGPDNTFIVVTADHGELLGEHGKVGHGHALHEELIRVPLVMCGPGVRPGVRVRHQVSHMDVTPTLLEALGVERPSSFVGRSLLPLLDGGQLDEEPVVSEEWDGRLLISCRAGGLKYVVEAGDRGTREALFDVRKGERPVGEGVGKLRLYVLRHVRELLSLRRALEARERASRVAAVLRELLRGARPG